MKKVEAKTIYKVDGKTTPQEKYKKIVEKARRKEGFAGEQIIKSKRNKKDEFGRVILIETIYNFKTE